MADGLYEIEKILFFARSDMIFVPEGQWLGLLLRCCYEARHQHQKCTNEHSRFHDFVFLLELIIVYLRPGNLLYRVKWHGEALRRHSIIPFLGPNRGF